jgi:hypothetical protein
MTAGAFALIFRVYNVATLRWTEPGHRLFLSLPKAS